MRGRIILLVVLAILLPAALVVANNAPVTVQIDGQQLETDPAPVIVGNSTLIPLRPIFEALGAEVEWDQDTRTVTATRGDITVKLSIGSARASVNGVEVTLDVPAQIKEDTTFVPLRFVSQALGASVDWDASCRVIISTSGEEVLDRASALGCAGSDTCLKCHEAVYNDFRVSGHGYKLMPAQEAKTRPIPLPKGYTWDDIS